MNTSKIKPQNNWGLLCIFFSFALMAAQPQNFLTPIKSTPLFQHPQSHSVRDTTDVKAKPISRTEPDEHNERWTMVIGLLTALFSIVWSWVSIIFFAIALVLIINAILYDPNREFPTMRRSPGVQVTGNLYKFINTFGTLFILLQALIALAIAFIILSGKIFLWIGLGIFAIGLIWWLVKVIYKILKSSRGNIHQK